MDIGHEWLRQETSDPSPAAPVPLALGPEHDALEEVVVVVSQQVSRRPGWRQARVEGLAQNRIDETT